MQVLGIISTLGKQAPVLAHLRLHRVCGRGVWLSSAPIALDRWRALDRWQFSVLVALFTLLKQQWRGSSEK